MKDLGAAIAQRKAEHLYRERLVIDGPQGPEIMLDGKRCLNFCSNDYLGLANHPEVVAALMKGAGAYGAGSSAAHLVCGHLRVHHLLEEELASFVQRPRALLFSTGYMANLGIASALTGRDDYIVEDRLNHASLIDAARLSDARLLRYHHGDTDDLRRHLENVSDGSCLIASDGVFSMDGDLAPVSELAAAARQHQALLWIDDAHGFGVLGEKGRGTLEHLGLGMTEVPILMGTLGKALGTFGAFVAGGEELIETLIQQARTYIYTTAIPPAVAEATRASLRLLGTEAWRREQLAKRIAQFRSGAAELELPLMDSGSAIQPLLVGGSEQCNFLSEALRRNGILITAIRPPTVPKGTARLRITLSAGHSPDHVDRLLSVLESLFQDFELPCLEEG